VAIVHEVSAMVKKLIPYLIVIIAAVLCVLASSATAFAIYPEERLDLLCNLFAESTGIVISVLVIDFLAKWREERREAQRWLSAKCRLYARLVEMVDDFLVAVLPDEFREVTPKLYRYKYGDIYAVPMIRSPGKEDLSRLHSLIEGSALLGRTTLFHVSRMRKQLDALLDRWAFLLDSEPMDLLMRLSFALSGSVQTDVDWTEEGPHEEFARWLGEVISVALQVRAWLERPLKEHFVAEGVTG
jgi:hypothetical protein